MTCSIMSHMQDKSLQFHQPNENSSTEMMIIIISHSVPAIERESEIKNLLADLQHRGPVSSGQAGRKHTCSLASFLWKQSRSGVRGQHV